MRYEERPAPDSIAHFVERFWCFSVEAHEADVIEHVIPPDGCVNIAVVRTGPERPVILGVSGPALKAIRMDVQKGVEYFGIRLRPEAAGVVSGDRATELIGRRSGLYEVNPVLTQALERAVPVEIKLESFVDAVTPSIKVYLQDQPDLDKAIAPVVDRLMQADPALSLTDVLSVAGLSERQMRRRFIRATGLTPKTFARIRRVRRAIVDLTLNPKPNAADISFAHGFADQPHLSREVREVFDLSPNLLTQYLNQIRHINLAERT